MTIPIRIAWLIHSALNACMSLCGCRTAYYDSMGNLVTDRLRIARHYLRTWCVCSSAARGMHADGLGAAPGQACFHVATPINLLFCDLMLWFLPQLQ